MEPDDYGAVLQQRPEIYSQDVKTEISDMSETNNFFKNPNSSDGWGAGVGGLIGAAVGSGTGLFGGHREPSVTPDQLDARFNSLQGQMGRDGIRSDLADLGLGLGGAITGVKDAVNHSSAHTNLALCGLGHTIQSGFAETNKTIVMEAARGRELQLADALAQARAEIAQARNDAGHTATQVMVQNLVNAGKA